jgi:outer membrane protein TolC
MKTLFQCLSLGVGVAIALGQSSISIAQPIRRSALEEPEPPLFQAKVQPAEKIPAKPTVIPPSAQGSPVKLTAIQTSIPGAIVNPVQTASTLPFTEAAQIVAKGVATARATVPTQKLAQTPPPPAKAPTSPTAKPSPAPSPAPTTPPVPTTPTPTTPTPTAPPTTVGCPPVDTSESKVPRRPAQAIDLLSKPLRLPTNPCEVRILGAQPLSLQEALTLAERGSQDVEIARLQVEQAQAAQREAQAANYPTLGLQADLTRSGDAFISGGATINPLTGRAIGGTQTNLSTSLSFSYNLFSATRRSTIQSSEQQVRAGELALERIREQLRLDTTTQYYDLQDADQQVIINQAAVTNAEANLRDSQAQERAGLGTRLDVLRAEVNLANSRQQLANALSTQTVRRRQLSSTLSLSYATITAADRVEPAGTWNLPLEDSIVLAYKNRAELQEQLIQRDISDSRIRTARGQNAPTLSFTASYQYQRADTPSAEASNTDGYSLGLQARWNLFDGGAANAQILQREKDREIAESRFSQNRNQIRFQVEQAFSELQAQRGNIATTEQAVLQAEEALRLAVLRFQAGVGTQTERINAEAELTRARANRVSAIIGYNRALAQLRRAVSNIASQ